MQRVANSNNVLENKIHLEIGKSNHRWEIEIHQKQESPTTDRKTNSYQRQDLGMTEEEKGKTKL